MLSLLTHPIAQCSPALGLLSVFFCVHACSPVCVPVCCRACPSAVSDTCPNSGSSCLAASALGSPSTRPAAPIPPPTLALARTRVFALLPKHILGIRWWAARMNGLDANVGHRCSMHWLALGESVFGASTYRSMLSVAPDLDASALPAPPLWRSIAPAPALSGDWPLGAQSPPPLPFSGRRSFWRSPPPGRLAASGRRCPALC